MDRERMVLLEERISIVLVHKMLQMLFCMFTVIFGSQILRQFAVEVMKSSDQVDEINAKIQPTTTAQSWIYSVLPWKFIVHTRAAPNNKVC